MTDIRNPAAIAALARGDMENFVAAATPGGIERQEAEGQRAFVSSDALPKKIRNADWDRLIALGFRFGEDVDDLFVQCVLPPGWTKRATDHSMHTSLLDELGRARANVFYKAAFYDRRADLWMNTRYCVQSYLDGSSKKTYRCVVRDVEEVVFETEEFPTSDYQAGEDRHAIAVAWLDSNRPNWRDPFAYWSEP